MPCRLTESNIDSVAAERLNSEPKAVRSSLTSCGSPSAGIPGTKHRTRSLRYYGLARNERDGCGSRSKNKTRVAAANTSQASDGRFADVMRPRAVSGVGGRTSGKRAEVAHSTEVLGPQSSIIYAAAILPREVESIK